MLVSVVQDVKKGVLCQLFGGCHKAVGSHKFRSDINILLVCASDLPDYVHASVS